MYLSTSMHRDPPQPSTPLPLLGKGHGVGWAQGRNSFLQTPCQHRGNDNGTLLQMAFASVTQQHHWVNMPNRGHLLSTAPPPLASLRP